MNKTKAIIASLIAGMSIGVVGIGAYASTNYAYSGFGEYSLSRGDRVITNWVDKADEEYAAVHFEEGSVSSYSPAYFRIRNRADTATVTNEKTAYSLANYSLNYISGEGSIGAQYRLSINAGYSGVTVKGKWAP